MIDQRLLHGKIRTDKSGQAAGSKFSADRDSAKSVRKKDKNIFSFWFLQLKVVWFQIQSPTDPEGPAGPILIVELISTSVIYI